MGSTLSRHGCFKYGHINAFRNSDGQDLAAHLYMTIYIFDARCGNHQSSPLSLNHSSLLNYEVPSAIFALGHSVRLCDPRCRESACARRPIGLCKQSMPTHSGISYPLKGGILVLTETTQSQDRTVQSRAVCSPEHACVTENEKGFRRNLYTNTAECGIGNSCLYPLETSLK